METYSRSLVALEGKSVLIVEDEPLIALDTKQIIENAGAARVYVARTMPEACIVLQETQDIDIALLDISLGPEPSFPLAESLLADGISFVFSTGYTNDARIPDHLATVPLLKKPYAAADLIAALAAKTSICSGKE